VIGYKHAHWVVWVVVGQKIMTFLIEAFDGGEIYQCGDLRL